jgi:uncharacterized integral membrane protein
MANLWLKVRVWTKVVVFALIAVYVICFIVFNRHAKVDVWVFFGATLREQPLLEVILITLVIGIVGTLTVGLLRSTIRQIRDVRERSRQERLQKDVADMKAKAGKLQTEPPKA